MHAPTLNEAFKIVSNGREAFDLVLLDISLPDGNGIKSLSQLKDAFQTKTVPFLVLSVDDDILSKVAAFGVGADDYILKPPNPLELKARIEARLRFSQAIEKEKNQIQIGDLLIDSNKISVEHTSSKGIRSVIELTPSEFKLLKLLAGRPGQVFTRDYLIDSVWGISKHVTERTVDAHISHLRKKISMSQVKIQTVLSSGYKITTDNF